jgi:class 3 adenylate cyclase
MFLRRAADFAMRAVMAIFGVPRAHEDDPVRAIRAAREIHEMVDAMSPEVEDKIGQGISMHSGIHTGLVVTGEVDMLKGPLPWGRTMLKIITLSLKSLPHHL